MPTEPQSNWNEQKYSKETRNQCDLADFPVSRVSQSSGDKLNVLANVK